MGNFPKIAFKNFKNWIPETDVDGVDIDNSIVSDISVFRYKNGFVENDLDKSIVTLPAIIQSKINSGYALKSVKKFTHSKQGNKTLYVLWNGSVSSNQLLIYLDETPLSIDENDAGIDFLDEPNNINYNLVNDELKINLNCNATIGGKNVVLNLSLQYLDDRVYNNANGVKRNAGWYLCPRWLGWQYNNITLTEDKDETFLEDFEDTTYKFGLVLNDFGRTSADKYKGTYSIVNTNTVDTKNNKYFKITEDDISIVQFYAKVSGGGEPNVYLFVEGSSGESYKIISEQSKVSVGNGWYKIWFHTNLSGTKTVRVCIAHKSVSLGSTNTYTFPTVYIDNLSVISDTESGSIPGVRYYSVLAVYFNGQRAAIDIKPDAVNRIEIKEDNIDWRIVGYEVYRYDSNVNTFLLVTKISIEDNWDYVSPGTLLYDFGLLNEPDEDTTLDFNYNLPAFTRVDTQSKIYSEVTYKGRVYFVKDTYKVYQSHISGNGAIQPDSFPYNENQGFGYFVVSRTAINKALAISPTNDLVVFTNSGIYVYQIQPSGGTVFRRLRLISGSIGLSSRNSVARGDDGKAATSGLLWCDYNGIYYYPGGINHPVNLLIPTHLEWWLNIPNSEKNKAVAFYDEKRKHYTIYLDTKLLNYEIEYKSFKYSDFSKVDEYVGISDNILYFRDGNEVYSFVDTSYQNARIETHYSTGYGADRFGRLFKMDEIDHKILQEIYVVFGDGTDSDASVDFEFYFDGIKYPKTFSVDTSQLYWKIPAPIIRFRKIKAKVTVRNSKRVILKEIGFTATADGREPLGSDD